MVVPPHRYGMDVALPAESSIEQKAGGIVSVCRTVIARVEEVSVVCNAKLFACSNHAADDVIDRHQGPPPVLKDVGDDNACVCRDHRFERNIAVVPHPVRGRAVPVWRPVVGPSSMLFVVDNE